MVGRLQGSFDYEDARAARTIHFARDDRSPQNDFCMNSLIEPPLCTSNRFPQRLRRRINSQPRGMFPLEGRFHEIKSLYTSSNFRDPTVCNTHRCPDLYRRSSSSPLQSILSPTFTTA